MEWHAHLQLVPEGTEPIQAAVLGHARAHVVVRLQRREAVSIRSFSFCLFDVVNTTCLDMAGNWGLERE